MQHDMPQSLLVFAVSFTPETSSFGTFGGVAHPPPLRIFLYIFLILLLNCVYAHIRNLNCRNILILKKIEYRSFQGAVQWIKLHIDCVITKNNKCDNVLAYYDTLNVLLNI